MSSKGCQYIPLKDIWNTELLDYLIKIISKEGELHTSEIYDLVLNYFGISICKPDVMCLNYDYAHPEFRHQIRFALEEGRKRKQLFGLGGGNWIKYPNNENELKNLVGNELREKLRNKKTYEIEINEGMYIEDLTDFDIPPSKIAKIVGIFKRNSKLAKKLKKIYNHHCQICGFTFQKKNGQNYSESHHVKPLSHNGLDNIENLVILCANCHRILHYSNVIVKSIKGNNREIMINGSIFNIIYNPNHFQIKT